MPTKIEWAEESWNPTTGCDRVSPGCDNCYALTLAKRLKAMGQARYQADGDPRTSGPGFALTTHADTLDLPFTWRKPRRVFVNSMSDLFHDAVPDWFIANVFAVMACAPQHTFQLLTKRHGRMRSLLNSPEFHRLIAHVSPMYAGSNPDLAQDYVTTTWPLPNVWLGVSVEDQKRADLRVPALLGTPAAMRWLSCEPLLGPVNLDEVARSDNPDGGWSAIASLGHGEQPRIGVGIDWVVVGGESGPSARPMDPDWPRALRDQCVAAGVPFFFKQHGEWAPAVDLDPELRERAQERLIGQEYICRVGKKRAGRLLDGREWNEYPAPVIDLNSRRAS